MDKQGSASADDVALIKRKDSDRSAHPKTTRPAHKRGGPRTQVGKQKSCQNAVKHGVFSKLFLLKGESRSEFDSLLAGLRACYQPEGMLEEALVEKLAVLMWRQRRLLIAESVEIWKGREFIKWDGKQDTDDEAARKLRAQIQQLPSGMLELQLKQLRILESQLEHYGSNKQADRGILSGLGIPMKSISVPL